jgi:hypothetical protein
MLFGKGKIEMILGKYNYKPGESITGDINLKLKKTIRARGLTVQLIGEETISRRSSRQDRSETNRIYDVKIPLDGEKDYKGGTYKFEMKIPETILDRTYKKEEAPGGKIGTAVKAFKYLTSEPERTRTIVDWHVIANLDVPKAFDVTKKQQITIG